MNKRLLLILPALLLSGCGHQEPLYTAHYYETHKAAIKKELARCKKAETLSGNAKKNCETANNVYIDEGLFSGGSNTTLP